MTPNAVAIFGLDKAEGLASLTALPNSSESAESIQLGNYFELERSNRFSAIAALLKVLEN